MFRKATHRAQWRTWASAVSKRQPLGKRRTCKYGNLIIVKLYLFKIEHKTMVNYPLLPTVHFQVHLLSMKYWLIQNIQCQWRIVKESVMLCHVIRLFLATVYSTSGAITMAQVLQRQREYLFVPVIYFLL